MPALRAKGKGRTPQRRTAIKRLHDRLAEAESTLTAIRNGEVDALVVSGPDGERTVTIEGASHPYFVLLNAMSDGAALLESGGEILFGNRSLSDIAGLPMEMLWGHKLQHLLVTAEHGSFEGFLRERSTRQQRAREFTLATPKGAQTPVAISLSALSLEANGGSTRRKSRGNSVVMAIVTDLTYRKATDAARVTLLERLISAEDDERRRIARELHDETGQSLTALLVGLRAIHSTLPAKARLVASRLRDIAARTVDDVGRLARGLHPAVLDDMGLAAAGMRYTKDYARSYGTAVKFVADDVDSPRLTSLAAATMYRILQESLTNVARHANARKVHVELNRDDRSLVLRVRDNGVGFDTTRAKAAAGLGLNGMRERVTLLGGSLRIESTQGRGTVVHACVPVSREAPPPPQKTNIRTHPARPAPVLEP